jgi:hypothetical protein
MPNVLNNLLGVNMGASVQSRHNVEPLAWSSQQPIPIDHPLVPNEVREALGITANTSRLYRVVSASIVEWWLLDLDGELLNIFWQGGRLRGGLEQASVYVARGTIYEQFKE